MNPLGSTSRPTATAVALPLLLAALAASFAVLPGCIIVSTGGEERHEDCINPFDDSCFNCMDGCDDIVDSDGDGLADDAESSCNLDPDNADTDVDGVLDGDEDLDGDGATTAEEIAFGSDCADGGDFPGSGGEGEGEGEDPPPPPADTDGDGLSDDAEGDRGTDPNDADSDDDGDTDGAEVECNSSPLDPFFTCC